MVAAAASQGLLHAHRPNAEPAHARPLARSDPRVSHSMAFEDFRDDGGERIARPFTLPGEIELSRALAAPDNRSDMGRCFCRPKQPCNIADD